MLYSPVMIAKIKGCNVRTVHKIARMLRKNHDLPEMKRGRSKITWFTEKQKELIIENIHDARGRKKSHTLNKSHREGLARACSKINRIMEEVREYVPGAVFVINKWNFAVVMDGKISVLDLTILK